MIEWDAASIFEHVLRRALRGGDIPHVEVRYRPYAGMNHNVRLRDGKLEVRLSDLLRGAEPQVIEALAVILLAKLYGRSVPPEMRLRYRRFLLSRGMEQRIVETRRERGRKTPGVARGRCYDLTEVFEALNNRYFLGCITGLDLSWSPRPSRVRLGHYDPVHHAIVISSALDHPEVPRVVVEYILYHELLHVKHPVEKSRGRRRIHTAAFREEEKHFPGRAAALADLKTLLGVGRIVGALD
jgi:hypothetical protein